jgi:hypothetical protein
MAKLISRNFRAGPPTFGTCCAWFRQVTCGVQIQYRFPEFYIMYLTFKMTRLALQATTNSQQGLVMEDWDTGHAFLYFSDLELMNLIDTNNIHGGGVTRGLRY